MQWALDFLNSSVFLVTTVLHIQRAPFRLNASQFRVLGRIDRLNSQGIGCTRLELGCLACTATAILRHDKFAAHQRGIDHGDIVQVTGDLYEQNGRRFIQIDSFSVVQQGSAIRPSALLPREWVLPTFIPQLRMVIQHWHNIRHPVLKQFLTATFEDPSTAMGFMNAPGSLWHHHSYQAGLLEHTAEMLSRLFIHPEFQHPNIERDLAIVLTIIHDIGKTVTLVGEQKDGSQHDRGAYQPHDMAGLELLALPLARLERVDAPLANLIRGYFRPQSWYPKCKERAYKLVSALDRASARNHIETDIGSTTKGVDHPDLNTPGQTL